MFGHTGKILNVDLSVGRVEEESYSPEFARLFLGGNGFIARLIHERVAPRTLPFDQANAIVFVVGLLTGMRLG